MSEPWSKEIFAENLRRYIERSGKSQKEIAEYIGVSTSTFNEWTKGKKFPRIDKIELLAQFFNCRKSDLIEEKPATENGDRLSPRKMELIEKVKQMSDAELRKLDMLLRIVEEG